MRESIVQRCYWQGQTLAVEFASETIHLTQTEGLVALKQNRVSVPGNSASVPLFQPDRPRRLELIQQQISAARD